jgi:hypothetical protein
MEAHPDVARRLDLSREQVASASRMHVKMVGRGGATGEREFSQTDPRRHVHRLSVDPSPQRIERLEPTEKRLVRHRRIGPGEILIEVVVGVDEARRDQAARGIDSLKRLRSLTTTDVSDQAVTDSDPSTGDLASVIIDRRDEVGACE